MIPKIIHYCWYGYGKKSRLILKCMDSWKIYFPDYEIKEWNEGNTNLDENEYIRTAYANKKWAFVSDYVRMKMLYEYGGIYFDTDVEIVKHFPEEILALSAFTGFERYSAKVSPGLVFACAPGNPIVGNMVESYNYDGFKITNADNMKTINVRITELLIKKGLIEKDEKQLVENLTVFPSITFCGYDAMRRKIDIRPETITVHHYAASWFPWYRKVRFFFGTLLRRIMYK